MGQRTFIAINLPGYAKNKLAGYQERWPELPCRWTKKENLHITLEFLGYLTDEELVEICEKTDKMASEKKAFTVRLDKICYGPGNKKPMSSMNYPNSSLRSPNSSTEDRAPKMVWATGEKIKELNIHPHVTLGRIKAWQFKQMEPGQRPEINEDIDLVFDVDSIEIMESKLERGGPKYTTLQLCPLKD